MRTVNAKLFSEALKIHKKVISRRVCVPILANVRVYTDGANIVGESFDCETGCRTVTPSGGDGCFSTTVNGAELLDALKIHKKSDVEIDVTGEGFDAKIMIGGVELPTMPDDEFPRVEFDVQGEYANVSHDDLSRVAPAMGCDDTRPYLNGVYINSAIVATNGHRLHIIERLACSAHATIPSKTVNIATGMKSEMFALYIGDKKSRMEIDTKYGHVTFVSRHVDATFPASYRDIVNAAKRDNSMILTARCEHITSVLESAKPYADTMNEMVRIGTDGTLSAENDRGKFAPKLVGRWGHDGASFGVNVKYLVDAIRAANNPRTVAATAEIVVNKNVNAGVPIIVRDDSDSEFTALVMPVIL